MDKIAIISGGGKLPLTIGKTLLKKNYDVCFIILKGFTDINSYKNYKHHEISITSFKEILNFLKKNKIDKIIMAGKINRPTISEIKFDLTTLSLIKSYYLESKGDNQLLTTISNLFLKNGFPLFDWILHCPELFLNKDFITKTKPNRNSHLNMLKGLETFSIIGNADIGQSLVIQNKIILGIEAAEGTDELLKRCHNYKKKGDKGLLLKLSKYKQSTILDLPTIGIKTIKNIFNYEYEGIYIEKNKCIILDKDEVIEFCNDKKIFIATVNKIENI